MDDTHKKIPHIGAIRGLEKKGVLPVKYDLL